MSFKKVKVPPKDGTQFVGVWNFYGEIWAMTYRYNERGYLESYNPEIDEFETGVGFPNVEISFFIPKGI